MKKFISVILCVFMTVGFIGCSNEVEFKEEAKNEEFSQVIDENLYILEIEVKESHVSLDLNKHIKDAINAFTFEIPVDKAFYDGVSKGDTLNDDFRVGSFLTKGSFGSWDVTIKDKLIQKKDNFKEDQVEETDNRYCLTLKLKQSHFSLDFTKHAKDAINTITFDIPVDKTFYDEVDKGEDLAKDFRWGSFFTEGSVGNWKVTIEKKYVI